MSYPYRLRKLKLPTLAYRRIRGDMIEIYKRLHGKYDSNTSNIINPYKDHNKLNERTRGHMWKICHDISRLNLRKESFPNRAVNMWNFLPEYVVNAPNQCRFVQEQARQAVEQLINCITQNSEQFIQVSTTRRLDIKTQS